MSTIRCECGRPALALPRFGTRRSLKARAGIPVGLKGHDLCPQCFRRLSDSLADKELRQRKGGLT
jgi:hypothetical protein